MGMGATNELDRVAASLGLSPAVEVKLQPALDVPHGGVLFALPALLANGLLRHMDKYFKLPPGYYQLPLIFLLLAFLALARIRTLEKFRYCSPGEWGKLLGLDRAPEVRTLRKKISLLAAGDQPAQWSAELCRDWMEADPESAAALYIDGHVRVYHGGQTKLPRHYVARQRLCLRATTDYWVNAMDGQPFFLITKEVDPGLINVIENEIVPRLSTEVPHQPTPAELEADPLLHRFTLIFDREGYSPQLFEKMKQLRIACLSYHKYPDEDWLESEFNVRRVRLVSGAIVEMKLAERGVFIGKKIWLREIRKLSESGHQTAVLSTDYRLDIERLAAAMFARWSQENFFKYMREQYSLDKLADYGVEAIPDTTKVVNPEYRRLDGALRGQTSLLTRRLAKFGALNLEETIEPETVEKYERQKAGLQEEIAALRTTIERLKKERQAVAHHITIAELPEAERFARLSVRSKHLIDTIKMIAYRAETALANISREMMSHPDEARSLLQSVFRAEADIIPDETENILTVRLHHLASSNSDKVIRHLCDELNDTATIYPGTNLRIIYELVSSNNPRDQEV